LVVVKLTGCFTKLLDYLVSFLLLDH